MSISLIDAGGVSDALVTSLVVVVGLAVIYWLVARAARRFIQRVARRDTEEANRATTLWSMLRRFLLVVVVTVAVLTVTNVWGISIAPLLAVGSAVGVALGFGAQNLVRDVIGGFFILAEDQFRIGDVVSLAGVSGVVEDIRPRVTVLRDLDGYVHYVPNGAITVASNMTQAFAQAVVDVTLPLDVDVDRALAVMRDELQKMATEWQETVLETPEVLGVNEIRDTGVVLRAIVKTQPDGRWSVRREAFRRLKNRMDAEGIPLTIPTVVRDERPGRRTPESG